MPLGFTIEQTTTTKQVQIVTKKPRRVVFILRLPKWLSQQQYDLQLQRASSGWTYTLGVCRIVPWDSPFFIACRDGRIDEVKKLLSSGQASIYDRDETNKTSLAIAIIGRSLEVCTLLRREGIFTRLQHEDLKNLLGHLAILSIGPMESKKSLYRSITPPGIDDEDWFSEMWEKGTGINDHFVTLGHTCAQSATERLNDLNQFLSARREILSLYVQEG